MSSTLKFEDVLNLVKENNPKALEAWKDRKVSGATTLFNSPYRRKVVDEVRFKIRGGAQISFIGDPEQEKIIKIVGGRERAQRTLDYLTKYNEEHKDELSEEDELAADLLTTSLSKYIRILEIRQQEREAKKVKPITRVDMQDKLNEIDLTDKSEKEKLEEKKAYLLSMKDRQQLDYDKLKHKLEGIRIKIADKTIVTKKDKDGVKVVNFDALRKLHDQFEAIRPEVTEKGLDVAFINESLAEIKQELEEMKKPAEQKPTEVKPEDNKSEETIEEETVEDETVKRIKEAVDEACEDVDDTKVLKPELKLVSDSEEEEDSRDIPETTDLLKLFRRPTEEEEFPQTKFVKSVVVGEVAYDFGRPMDRYKMRRMALEMDLDTGAIKETFLMRFTPFRALRALIPSKTLRDSAMEKLEDETIPLGSIYEIPQIGEIRMISDKVMEKREKARQKNLQDSIRRALVEEEYEDDELVRFDEEGHPYYEADEVEGYEPAEIIKTDLVKEADEEEVDGAVSAEAEEKKEDLFKHIEAAILKNIEEEERKRADLERRRNQREQNAKKNPVRTPRPARRNDEERTH